MPTSECAIMVQYAILILYVGGAKVDFQRFIDAALVRKADRAAVVHVKDILFSQQVREWCKRNACGKYGTNWMCPPGVGDLEELEAAACHYTYGLVMQTVHPLEDSFDFEGMMDGKEAHEKVFRQVYAHLQSLGELGEMLPLNAGACTLCPRCAYLDEQPCRFPEKAMPSLEAYGIDVVDLVAKCGIPYVNGQNTVSYVGLILFNA